MKKPNPASAVLEYQRFRLSTLGTYNRDYQRWKANVSRTTPTGALPPDPKSSSSSDRTVDSDLIDLANLCCDLLLGEMFAFSRLLVAIEVHGEQGRLEVHNYGKALTDDIYEYRWRHGLMEHWYFADQLESSYVRKVWSMMTEPVLSRGERLYGELWRDRLKEIDEGFFKRLRELDAEERKLTRKEVIREMLLSVIRRHPEKDYREILTVLDESNRILMEDELFRDWHEEFGIQCWFDIADHKVLKRRFLKFRSTECPGPGKQ